MQNIYDLLRTHLKKIVVEHGMVEDPISVKARTLSSGEAIGNPEHDDYPLIVGQERMMEATIRGESGQAFTDMFGNWEGQIKDVINLDLTNNFRRAVFVSAINAAMRYTGELNDTRHCKDKGPVECAKELVRFVHDENLEPPFVLIGFQPRFAETLAKLGELRIVDMDIKHIGQQRFGTTVYSPEETKMALNGCKTAFITGTTLVNDTIHPFLKLQVPTVFYGVTIAAAAKILGLKRYCASGL